MKERIGKSDERVASGSDPFSELRKKCDLSRTHKTEDPRV